MCKQQYYHANKYNVEKQDRKRKEVKMEKMAENFAIYQLTGMGSDAYQGTTNLTFFQKMKNTDIQTL